MTPTEDDFNAAMDFACELDAHFITSAADGIDDTDEGIRCRLGGDAARSIRNVLAFAIRLHNAGVRFEPES